MTSAIELVVAAYVETNQLSALQDMKVHREGLAMSIRNRTDFNFWVLLGQLDDDIREIEAGIRRLRAAVEDRSASEL
ncbi:hypothetical protein [Tardiphaga sp.]|uniref:hypothetical protein n=1 Tax=Tardiphaga sp. TaxID=1926292 RepID=UPI00352B7154